MLCIYSLVNHISKVNIAFCFTTLNFYVRDLESSYDVTFLNDRLAGLIMRICIVFGLCDELNAGKFVMCLLNVVHVVEYVKR